ncbi:hypothetical protein NP233_g11244 [Leucocoprinus birnbaumii]|uniref:G domain-containing protein n=1 Tax=Leucocoprinus birnbaumii TaxID=56174 RepID=A0AAD5YR53_9AGAR|nr:hypothetical protein NP233_g11244 [Leucocoprinus birnbaumii]
MAPSSSKPKSSIPPHVIDDLRPPQPSFLCDELPTPTSFSSTSSSATGSTGLSYTTAFSSPSPYCESPMSISQHNFGDKNSDVPPIIAVMGPTGAGKSSFIKIATGSDEIVVGESLTSCTQVSKVVRCHNATRGNDVIFVDTPGFDDTFKSDIEILRGIAEWLEQTYKRGIQLSGILYLHRISDNRMPNSILRNFDMFQRLCGQNALSNIRLVTTSWDLLPDISEGERREEDLRTNFWNDLLENGSQMHRFQYTCASAWEIIDTLAMDPKPILIQRELVDQGLALETTAGKSFFSWATKVLKDFIAQVEVLLKKILSSTSTPRRAQHKWLKKYLKDARQELREIEDQRSLPSSSSSSSTRSSVESIHSSDTTPVSRSSSLSRRRRLVNHPRGRVQSVDETGTRMAVEPQLATESQFKLCDIPNVDSFYEVAIGRDPVATGTLTYTTQTLGIVVAAVTDLPVPGLVAAVSTALRIAERMRGMRVMNNYLLILVNNAGRLLKAASVRDQATRNYPIVVVQAILELGGQLKRVEEVTKRLQEHVYLHRFTLEPEDLRVLLDCNNAMNLILHSLGVRTDMAAVSQIQDTSQRLDKLQWMVSRSIGNYMQSEPKQRASI